MTKTLHERSDQTRLAGLERDVAILKRRPPGDVVLHIKVPPGEQSVLSLTTGDKKFAFAVSRDMDGLDLVDVEAYVTTVSSSGKIQIQLRNETTGQDILSTRLEIDAGEKNSQAAAVQKVIDRTKSMVTWTDAVGGDHIAIDVDMAGTGAKGLGLMLTFRQVR